MLRLIWSTTFLGQLNLSALYTRMHSFKFSWNKYRQCFFAILFSLHEIGHDPSFEHSQLLPRMIRAVWLKSCKWSWRKSSVPFTISLVEIGVLVLDMKILKWCEWIFFNSNFWNRPTQCCPVPSVVKIGPVVVEKNILMQKNYR